ncbi:MAG: ketoacyl-ACP synthase III [Desulfovibrio sp.]|jgi:3-oxoacyl-[acyl-carrier-protein] synthase-3|nr:ketoacyl-ACP synthase III [Desulfovibrio sp.]
MTAQTGTDRVAFFEGVRVAAVIAVLPADEIVFEREMLARGFSAGEARKAARLSGLERRRVAPTGVTAADICAVAAKTLLDDPRENGNAGSENPEDAVDALFFVSQSPDCLLPATSSILHGRLGLPAACACMDLNSGCAGYVMGLLACASLVACGAARRALLLTGDTQARFLNPDNRVTAPLFGDAGTATLLEKGGKDETMSFLWGGDGARYESLIIPGGGARIPPQAGEGPDAPFNAVITDGLGNPWTLGEYGQLWMDGLAVFSFGVSTVPAHIRRHLDLLGIGPQELDRLALHQANRLMLETIAQKCGLPLDKVPMNTLSRYGNLGAASIPVLLCDEFAAANIPLRKVMLCGFGAGLSWASCVLGLEKTRFSPPLTLTEADFGEDRQTAIRRWHERFASA